MLSTLSSSPPLAWTLAASWLLAILSLWCPAVGRVPAWAPCLAIAVAVGVLAGAIAPAGVLALLVLAVLCEAWRRVSSPLPRALLLALVIVVSLALALHLLPGFANPQLLQKVQVSAGAPPFSLYLNFDKAAVGILLCATFGAPARDRATWRALAPALPVLIATPFIVLAVGLLAGVVAFDPKWPAYAPVFLATNLLTTCVAEEAFFRALLQGRLAAALTRRGWRHGGLVAVGVAAVLFGCAHAAGGAALMAFATLAGVGYGLAYWRSGRIEMAILTHFAVNAVHFLLFTYPALR